MNRDADRRHFVYWLFDAAAECIYVGTTQNPRARWLNHLSRFGDEIASKRMAGPFTRQMALTIEREQQDYFVPIHCGRSKSLHQTRVTQEITGEPVHDPEPHWPIRDRRLAS